MTKYVCRHCGRNVGFWFYGWKHQTGGRTYYPTCGRRLTSEDIKEKKP